MPQTWILKAVFARTIWTTKQVFKGFQGRIKYRFFWKDYKFGVLKTFWQGISRHQTNIFEDIIAISGP